MAYQQTTVRREDPDEGFVDVFAVKDDKTGDIYAKTKIQQSADEWGTTYIDSLENQKTGDVYEILSSGGDDENPFYYPGKLIVNGAALKNPDIKNLQNGYDWRGADNPGKKYTDVSFIQQLYDLKQTNPNAYYNQLATDLGNQIAENGAYNKGEHNGAFNKQLNQIKEINPSAYYSAQLGILGDSVGWQIGQNRSDRNAPTIEKIQSLIPEAMAAGLTTEQINSIVNNSANSANIQNQTRIANDAASGGSGFNFGRDLAPALAIFGGAIGGAALGGAFSGAGALGSGAGGLTAASIPSLTTGLEVGTGSVLAGTGAGTAGGALSSLGSLAFAPPAIGGSAGFLAPTLGADLASTGLGLSAADISSLTTGLELGSSGLVGLGNSNLTVPDIVDSTVVTPTETITNAPLQGPTYQELGVTGVEGGMAGPTYSELGYTGLNLEEAAAAADAASKGLSASEILSNANRVKNLAKLLGGNSGTATKPTTGVNSQQLASLLGSTLPTQAAPGNIYRMNQNPFTFGTQGQTPVSQGMYDVSGTNPMANALRKA